MRSETVKSPRGHAVLRGGRCRAGAAVAVRQRRRRGGFRSRRRAARRTLHRGDRGSARLLSQCARPRTTGRRRVEVQSEDAHLLLEHLTPEGEQAYVFGGSGGAVVALDLLARHPRRLRLVIAHEPPSFGLLPDAAEHKAFVEEVRELFATEGLAAAGARFRRARRIRPVAAGTVAGRMRGLTVARQRARRSLPYPAIRGSAASLRNRKPLPTSIGQDDSTERNYASSRLLRAESTLCGWPNNAALVRCNSCESFVRSGLPRQDHRLQIRKVADALGGGPFRRIGLR